MHPFSLNLFWALSVFFFTPSFSSPSSNLTFFGDAFLSNNSIILTHETKCTPPEETVVPSPFTSLSGVGRAFSVNPVRFLDLSNNATTSFFCSFSFTITRNSSCPFGNGFAFQITSNTGLFSVYDGYMGLPEDLETSTEVHDSYFAVEFNKSFKPSLEDINGNHLGIDVNNIMSLASVDVVAKGIDLKNGKKMTAWIEYRDPEKVIRVWLGYSSQVKPPDPVLVAQIDLSKQFKEFMHVGFSASNGRGSSTHVVDQWRFKTFFGI